MRCFRSRYAVSCTLHSAHNGVMSFVIDLLNTFEGLTEFVIQLCSSYVQSLDRSSKKALNCTYGVMSFVIHLLNTCKGLNLFVIQFCHSYAKSLYRSSLCLRSLIDNMVSPHNNYCIIPVRVVLAQSACIFFGRFSANRT
jgi:hypothetical protein